MLVAEGNAEVHIFKGRCDVRIRLVTWKQASQPPTRRFCARQICGPPLALCLCLPPCDQWESAAIVARDLAEAQPRPAAYIGRAKWPAPKRVTGRFSFV